MKKVKGRVVFALLAAALFVGHSAPVGAAVLDVCSSGCPYTSIQAAINASSTGDTVQVSDGTYHERLVFSTGTPSITLTSVNGPQTTIIDGSSFDGTRPLVAVAGITFPQTSVPPQIINGFTIQNAKREGVSIYNAEVTVSNCVIRGNQSGPGGGITAAEFSEVRVVNCTITGNNSYPGTYGFDGGGILLAGPFSTLSVVNSTISGNNGVYSGGIATFADPQVTFTMVNSIVWGNTIQYGAAVNNLNCGSQANVSATYSDIGANSCYPGQLWPGAGNISDNPSFVDFRAYSGVTIAGDYHLRSNSTCINAGDPASAPPAFPAADIDGEARAQGGAYDMGSDENGSDCVSSSEVCDGVDNDCDRLIDDNDPSLAGGLPWYVDADGDLFGNELVWTYACLKPAGYVADTTDCNDINATIHPGAPEVIKDSIDQDCNGFDLTTVVTKAVYKGKILTVEATSDRGAAAALNVTGYGAMTWNKKTLKWTLSKSVATRPATVTVTGIEGAVTATVQ